MRYEDPKIQQLVEDFQDHLAELVEKFSKASGHQILIGYSMEDEVGTVTGAVASDALLYEKAMIMCGEITHYVVGNYTYPEDEERG